MNYDWQWRRPMHDGVYWYTSGQREYRYMYKGRHYTWYAHAYAHAIRLRDLVGDCDRAQAEAEGGFPGWAEHGPEQAHAADLEEWGYEKKDAGWVYRTEL